LFIGNAFLISVNSSEFFNWAMLVIAFSWCRKKSSMGWLLSFTACSNILASGWSISGSSDSSGGVGVCDVGVDSFCSIGVISSLHLPFSSSGTWSWSIHFSMSCAGGALVC